MRETHMKAEIALSGALVALAIYAAACNSQPTSPIDPQGDPLTSSETHWLQACDSDVDCGPLACICKVCTLVCDASADCTDGGLGGVCSVVGEGPNGELCLPDEGPEGVCLPGCDLPSQSCAGARLSDDLGPLVCRAQHCLPNATVEAASARREVDILFVVDNSGSMCEEQAQLRDNVDLFVDQLSRAGVSFNIAVVTTDIDDPTESGQFQNLPDGETGPACTQIVDISECPSELGQDPPPLVISSSDSRYRNAGVLNIEAVRRDLGCSVTVGTRGNGFEAGLEAARLALSPGLLGTTNTDFLREDALLAVVFLTDENDCSDGGALDKTNGNICEWESDQLVPVEEYVDHFVSLKGDNPENLVLAGIFAPDSGLRWSFGEEVIPSCTSDLGEGYSGWRYEEAVESVPFHFAENICADNFSDGLSSIAQTIQTALRTR